MKPLRKIVGVRSFLSSSRGDVALVAAYLALPMLGFSLLMLEAINYHQADIRLDRAVVVNAVLGAKEGPAADPDELEAIQTALLKFNVRSVLGAEESKEITPEGDNKDSAFYEARASLPYSTIYAPAMRASITAIPEGSLQLSADAGFRAERQPDKAEYVFVLDASASMRGSHLVNIRAGLRRFVRNLFGSDDTSRYSWVSFVEFSDNVNVGSRYADELINPASRAIPREWDEFTETAAWRVAQSNGGYSDYLDPKGPEGKRQGACVARKSNSARTDFMPMGDRDGLHSSYANMLENPPTSSERFDLLIGVVEENVCEKYSETVYKTDGRGNKVCAKRAGDPGRCVRRWRSRRLYEIEHNRGDCKDPYVATTRSHPGERGMLAFPPDVIDWMGLDKDVYTIQTLPGISYMRISAYPACGQPMLIASNSKTELLDYIDGYNGVYQTATDEGFAWGYRALHPDWQSVWHSAADRAITAGVPADFGGGVQKKFILFSDGFPNEGYFANSPTIPSVESSTQNIRRFCRYIKGEANSSPREVGDIEVTVIILGDGQDYGSGAFNMTRDHCPSQPADEHFIQTESSEEIRDFLEELGKLEYRTRLVPNSS